MIKTFENNCKHFDIKEKFQLLRPLGNQLLLEIILFSLDKVFRENILFFLVNTRAIIET